jgi:2-desacetyl-2-hydroxyethyl bacteriochlorophyllide A dehydrogenase
MLSHHLVLSEPFHLRWEEIDVPDPGPGEVLIRTRKTLISTGTELTAYTGDFPPNTVWSDYVHYPWYGLGYSNVGQVSALGPGVTEIEVGQRVMSNGRHATFNLRPASAVWPIPNEVTDDQAVFLDIGRTVMNGVRLSHIVLGESVVIVGAGILGQLATQYLSRGGAFPLIVVDLSERRLHMAEGHGATHTLIGERDELLNDIRRIARGRMADVAFEITGNQEVIPTALQMVRRQGRVILLGSPRHPVAVDFHNEIHTLGLHVIGAHTSTQPEVETYDNPWTRRRNSELFFDLVMAGWLQLDDMITHRYPWREAPAAYEMLAEDRTRAMGVVFEGWTEG